MASNLPGDVCVGQHSVCVMRAAILGNDCSAKGGVDSGFITAGIVTATASPVLRDGTTLEPETGTGRIGWTYEQPSQLRAMDLSGEILFFDHEMMEILFGGKVVVGAVGTPFAGENIGWAAPNYTDDPPPPIYLEFIVRTAAEGIGECGEASGAPYAVGHIFGKCALSPGDWTFQNDAAQVNFQGRSVANPNLGEGPWGDWPGVDDIPNSPHIQVSYSRTQFEALEDLASCGWATIPTGD